jgi:protein dpy-30
VQESTVVPLLMQGMQALCKERPDNPVEYLANFLLQHGSKQGGSSGGAPPSSDN